MYCTLQGKSKFYKFISKRRFITLAQFYSLTDLAQFLDCLVFIGSFTVFTFIYRISNVCDLSITEEISLVKIRIWCIKSGIILVLPSTVYMFFNFFNYFIV
jgi:hypothetical protein